MPLLTGLLQRQEVDSRMEGSRLGTGDMTVTSERRGVILGASAAALSFSFLMHKGVVKLHHCSYSLRSCSHKGSHCSYYIKSKAFPFGQNILKSE